MVKSSMHNDDDSVESRVVGFTKVSTQLKKASNTESMGYSSKAQNSSEINTAEDIHDNSGAQNGNNLLDGVTDNTEELTVRPSKLDEIIGRDNQKKKIRMMIKSAQKRGNTVDHVLFYGPPGLGKTTFAIAIANEMGSSLHVTSGPAILRQADLATILTNLKKNDVLFIDEIHRLSRSVEEVLYPAMEDMKLDIVLGKGVSANSIRIDLQPFTLIGATTRIGLISSPLRDRFGLIQRLDFFDNESLVQILHRASGIWGMSLEPKAVEEIASRSRGTARVALRLLRRIRDYVDSEDNNVGGEDYAKIGDLSTKKARSQGKNRRMYEEFLITYEMVIDALNLLEVDRLGLEDIDHRIISTMYNNFCGGPVGLSTLSAAIGEDVGAISDVNEPFLMRAGLIKRTSRGRVLTEKGILYAQELNDKIL